MASSGSGGKASDRKAADGKDLPQVEVYTRGCALELDEGGQGAQVGGYAAVLVCGETSEVASGAWPSATNNAMELWAVIAGLRCLEERSRVTVYTPSKYVLHGATQWLPAWRERGWQTRGGKLVKNKKLWEELGRAVDAHAVTWRFLPQDERVGYSQAAAQAARLEAEKVKEEKGQSE
ncbi:MAG: ribonuclease H [Chloroflexota bacterium]|nr:ribonuclease H [Chloroflexota bacterium]